MIRVRSKIFNKFISSSINWEGWSHCEHKRVSGIADANSDHDSNISKEAWCAAILTIILYFLMAKRFLLQRQGLKNSYLL